MRVAVYYSNRDVRLEERATPTIGPGELLLRVHASGICGSDVMEWYRRDKAPLVLGHEIAAEIVECGTGVNCYRVGQRVAASHHVPCGCCEHCYRGHPTACETLRRTNFDPGGFAEYVRLPAINVARGVYPIPDALSNAEATFAEPIACVLRGLVHARFAPGDCVAVIGTGLAGLLFVKLAVALGAGPVVATDLLEFRRDAARRFGAALAADVSTDLPAAVREVNHGRLADCVIVATGSRAAIERGFSVAERGARILLFAPPEPGTHIPLPFDELLWRNEIDLVTSYAASPADYADALRLIAARRVTVTDMITHRLPLAEAQAGFELVANPRDSLKVILEPQQ